MCWAVVGEVDSTGCPAHFAGLMLLLLLRKEPGEGTVSPATRLGDDGGSSKPSVCTGWERESCTCGNNGGENNKRGSCSQDMSSCKHGPNVRISEFANTVKSWFKIQNLVTKIEFHITKSRFSVESQFKELKSAEQGHSLI